EIQMAIELILQYANQIVLSCPYTCPSYLPKVMMAVALIARKSKLKVLHHSVIEVLRDFKRTDQDTWQVHEKAFRKEELAVLHNVLISPNYYV
uniref:DUF3437 domain-containing protein n=1 Tax=Rhabditophanes sp. KR3021 TaxID=114890 RepID=A0AC35TS74_9BILA